MQQPRAAPWVVAIYAPSELKTGGRLTSAFLKQISGYIKAHGEVDVAYINDHRFWPIEVKWANQIRSKDLAQIAKYNNGKVLTRRGGQEDILGISAQPVVVGLWELG